MDIPRQPTGASAEANFDKRTHGELYSGKNELVAGPGIRIIKTTRGQKIEALPQWKKPPVATFHPFKIYPAIVPDSFLVSDPPKVSDPPENTPEAIAAWHAEHDWRTFQVRIGKVSARSIYSFAPDGGWLYSNSETVLEVVTGSDQAISPHTENHFPAYDYTTPTLFREPDVEVQVVEIPEDGGSPSPTLSYGADFGKAAIFILSDTRGLSGEQMVHSFFVQITDDEDLGFYAEVRCRRCDSFVRGFVPFFPNLASQFAPDEIPPKNAFPIGLVIGATDALPSEETTDPIPLVAQQWQFNHIGNLFSPGPGYAINPAGSSPLFDRGVWDDDGPLVGQIFYPGDVVVVEGTYSGGPLDGMGYEHPWVSRAVQQQFSQPDDFTGDWEGLSRL